jgi:hypothetical protein
MGRWLTPDTAGGDTVCRVLVIPVEYLPSVNGALQLLADANNWEMAGTATPEEAADLMQQMVEDYYNATDGSCP